MEIRNFKRNDINDVVNLWNETVKVKDFYFQFSVEELTERLFNNKAFDEAGAFVAVEDDKIVGFACGFVRIEDREDFDKPGYFNTIVVHPKYQRRYIGTKLFERVVQYFKDMKRTYIRSVYISPVNYPWYVPESNHHNHPGAPAIPINSSEYFFLIRLGFDIQGQIDAFHLPLQKYQMPEKVLKLIEENKKHNRSIEVYDASKHYGIEEFCEAIDNPGFARSIRYNLNREKPYPFLVAQDNGKVVGWTGPMYTEASGRGHLDGIAVDPNARGAGLGKMLFCTLCDYSKKQGSSFMTFFTGLENPARRIYLFAGFRVAQSFAIMKKEI